MIITTKMALQNIKDCANKYNKLASYVKDGKLIKIVRGLYETDSKTPGYLLAESIYNPSYLSFDYALYYYDMIPEKAVNYSSATFKKGKKKKYSTPFGTYYYQDVPEKVYPYEVDLIRYGEYSFKIATREKALCDKLYSLSPVKNTKELEYLLFKDLRIDEEEFYKLDTNKIERLSELYHSKNVKLLYKYMRSLNNE